MVVVEQPRPLELLEGFPVPGLVQQGPPFSTMLFRLIDRMALFTLSHLLLYVRGETAENTEFMNSFAGIIKTRMQCFKKK